MGVSENLNLSRSCQLREEYKALFEYAAVLKKQRNLIVHQYEVQHARLNWKKVWTTINSNLEDALLPELNNVIEKENKGNIETLAKERKAEYEDSNSDHRRA